MDRLLVLVRHGQSDWNLKNLFTGWKDVGLSEKGIVEARAAAALSRCGGRPGFERVIHLLHNSSPEAQPLLAGTLVVYAERLQGGPLSEAELRYLGSSAPAWARWYAEFVKRVPA